MLASEVLGLQSAVYVLALFAILSSVLALVRDRLLAHAFGAGLTLDLYNAAFRIPDLIFVGIGALVSVYILIPELSRRTEEERKTYIDTIISGFSLLAIVVCGVAFVFAPQVFALFFPKLAAGGQLDTLTTLSRIMLLQPILLGFSNILAAITQSRHRYFLYALSPLLYNVGIIVGITVLYPMLGIAGLAWGVVVGAALHAGIQVPSIVKDGYLKNIPRLHDVKALFDTVVISIPRALTLSMNQLTYLGLAIFAGLLAPGSIAIFTFAFNLQAVPLSIIGASYSVAAFPTLAAALARGERSAFISHVGTAARHVVFWSLPTVALMIILRAHVVRVILGSGAFTWTDTRLTAAAFALFSLSLVAQGLMLLIVRAYYAAGRTFIPFFVAALVAAATLILAAATVGALNIPFVLHFTEVILRVVDVPGTGVLALAFAYAIVSVAGTILLLIHFERRFGGFLRSVLPSWGQSLLAALACGAATYGVLQLVGPITLSSTLLTVFVRGFTAGAVGIATCAAAYHLLGSREYGETMATIRGRLQRAPLPPSVVTAAEEQAVP